jgi:hypothetical protein
MIRRDFSVKTKSLSYLNRSIDVRSLNNNLPKISLPPIQTKLNSSSVLMATDWKITGSNSPLFKQAPIKLELKKRKPNVVLNLKRGLKNPYSYISGKSVMDLDFKVLEEKFRKISLKTLANIELN